jgi:hypothetical protein
MRRTPIALVLTLLACRAAFATTAAQIPCLPTSPAPMPCVVDSNVSITDASTLDFGTRGLTLTSHGTLDVGTGSMTIFAGSLVVQAGGLMVARAGSIDVTTTGDIRVEAAGTSRGRVDVSGSDGGFLTLTAAGNLAIDGQILGDGTATAGGGASIDVTGANTDISGTISATGGSTGFGGDISISAVGGSVAISGRVDASGGDGGAISVDADADVTVTSSALLDGNSLAGGSGDTIDLTSFGGNVTLAGTIRAHAPGDLVNGGGSGADFCADASGTITNDASIDMSGGGQDGLGGSAEFTTDGDIIQRGAIDVSAAGSAGYAGLLSFTTSYGLVDLSGGNLDVIGPGQGGDISAFSYNGIRVANRLTADGPNASIDLQGCAVDVLATARLSSAGVGGDNILHASGLMTVAGMLSATVNTLEYRDPMVPPVLTGSTINPPPVQMVNPALIVCGGPTTTTTSTTTTTTTVTIATTTSTTTTTTTIIGATTTTSTTATTATTSTITVPTTTNTTTTNTTATTVAPTTTTTSTLATTSTSVTTTSTTQSTGTSTTSTTLGSVVCDPPDCNDGNSCTDGVCDPERGCVYTDRTGFDAITCRLESIVNVLATAPVDDVGGPGTRGRFQGKLAKIQRMVDLGKQLTGKRQTTKLRRANKLLTAFIHTVEKGEHRGKVKENVGKEMTDLASSAQSSLRPFIL